MVPSKNVRDTGTNAGTIFTTNSTSIMTAEQRWKKLQPSAVESISALELLERELERRYPITGQSTMAEQNESSSLSMTDGIKNATATAPISPTSLTSPCLLNNPLLNLPLGCVTELAGPAGAGKTQLALSMCAETAMRHNEKAVYVALGGSGRHLQTISRRLKGMLQRRIQDERKEPNNIEERQLDHVEGDIDEMVQDCLSRIFVRWICNSDELFEMLHTSLPKLLHLHSNLAVDTSGNPPVSMVILDGIADLFRIRDDAYDSKVSSKWHRHRAIALFQISNLCKEMSLSYQVPFLVINGATTRLDTTSRRQSEVPALGLAWSQCVNSSFFVDRLPMTYMQQTTFAAIGQPEYSTQQQDRESRSTTTDARQRQGCYRRLRCLKAPNIDSIHHQEFYIDQRGVVPA